MRGPIDVALARLAWTGVAAVAAGSTIAGNLLILGAASNVIIIPRAERHGETLGLMEFARSGIPLTCLNLLVYALYLWAMQDLSL